MTATAWTGTEYQALINRLLADNARLRGLTVEQARLHYCLPDRPPMHPTMEATPWRTPRT